MVKARVKKGNTKECSNCCTTALISNASKEKKESEVTPLYPTLCDPMDCSLPGSPIHGLFQARVLEWLPFPLSGDLPDPGIEPGSPALQADAFTV